MQHFQRVGPFSLFVQLLVNVAISQYADGAQDLYSEAVTLKVVLKVAEIYL